MPRVLVIGFGKLGSSLTRFLIHAQIKVQVVDPKPYDPSFERVVKKKDYFEKLSAQPLAHADLIFICVRDDQISGIVRALKSFPLKNKRIVHTSGVTDADVLEPLRKQGASVGSFHPLQTFNVPLLPAEHWHSIYCTFQGDAEIQSELQEIFRPAGVKIIAVNRTQKQAVHLAAVVSANFQVALYAWASEIIKQAGLENITVGRLLAPLVEQTAKNFSQRPLNEILSGPLQRGDLSSIRRHLDFLSKNSDELSIRLYRLLSEKLLQNEDFNIQDRKRLQEFFKGLEK